MSDDLNDNVILQNTLRTADRLRIVLPSGRTLTAAISAQPTGKDLIAWCNLVREQAAQDARSADTARGRESPPATAKPPVVDETNPMQFATLQIEALEKRETELTEQAASIGGELRNVIANLRQWRLILSSLQQETESK